MRLSQQPLVASLLAVAAIVISCRSVEAIRPLPPNRTMLQAAPEDCAVFFHSFGFTKPDPDSPNKTEQMLADPEIQALLVECNKFIDFSLQKGLDAVPEEERAEMEFAVATMKKIIWRPMTIYLGSLDLTAEEPTFKLGLLIDLGEHEQDVKQLAERMQENAGEDAKSTTVSGVSCVEIQVEADLPGYWAIHQGMLLVTMGDSSFAELLEQIKSDTPSWMKPVVKRLPAKQRGMFGYVDFSQVDQAVAQSDDVDMKAGWKALGLGGIQHGAFMFGLEGDGLIVRKLLACDSFDGLLKIVDNEGLSAEDIARIPGTAATAFAMQFDPAKTFDTLMDIARRLNPDAETDIQEMRQKAMAALGGLDLRDDLLAAFGDKWVLYQSGGFATMMVPDMVGAVNLRDEQKASTALDAVVELARQSLARDAVPNAGVPVVIKPRKFGEAEGYSVRGLPVALSFCVHNNELIVGLSAAAIKNHLKYEPKLEDSIAVNPRLKPLLDKYQRPLLVSYSDVAKSIENSYPSLQMMANMLSGQFAQQGIEFDPTAIPPVTSITQYLEPSVYVVSRVPDGIEAEAREVMPRISGPTIGVPIAVALLLPAVNAARAAARRITAINNARQLGLAMLNFESANARLPSADKGGLSWRVHVLPFLEEQALYDKFHLDEPWDSEHNKALIKEMPALYVSPTGNAPQGKTNYLAVRGKDPVIVSGEKGLRLGKISDGVSKTIMLVEVDDELAVPWTKPADYEWSEDDPAKGLGGMHAGGVFVACFVDCHALAISKTVARDTLSALFTKSGGEAVDLDALAP